MGPGQRTIAVPIRRHPRVRIARLGSKTPIFDPNVSMAGARVSEAASATRTPRPAGMPRLAKYGNLVKARQNTAPATVRPEPSTMWAVPRNMV